MFIALVTMVALQFWGTGSALIDIQKNQIEQAKVYVESLARVEKELKRIGDHLEAKPLLPDVRIKEVKQ